MVGLKKKKVTYYAKMSPKMVNARDTAGNAEEEPRVCLSRGGRLNHWTNEAERETGREFEF